MKKDVANDMLYKNFTLNVDMIECIRRGGVNILFASSDGVLIQDESSEIYMISAHNIDVAKKMIDLIPLDAEIIVVHQDFYCKLIEDRVNLRLKMACYYSTWMKKSLIRILKSEVEVKLLTEENLNMVANNYSSIDLVGKEYIEERIESGNMLGAFIDNSLCGFIGNHEEGSIGLLEVLKEYRGKGIATILQAEATNKALKDGRIPYGEVKDENEKSLGLQRKLGFEISKNKIYWLMK